MLSLIVLLCTYRLFIYLSQCAHEEQLQLVYWDSAIVSTYERSRIVIILTSAAVSYGFIFSSGCWLKIPLLYQNIIVEIPEFIMNTWNNTSLTQWYSLNQPWFLCRHIYSCAVLLPLVALLCWLAHLYFFISLFFYFYFP